MTRDKNCIFCNITDRIFKENEVFFAIEDRFPVSKGHSLIIPKKHIVSFFELDTGDMDPLLQLIKEVKIEIDKKCSPDGYNIGVNDGRCAGRTVDHLHFHLIPRYEGDVPEPRGGVRKILPGGPTF
jgi:diadenosine tetraphosphate (Ap4A) HIT family hydrolase